MAVESQVLRDRGLSESVIPTLLKARKQASRKIYHRTWKAFFRWCEDAGCSPRRYSVPRILVFLQQGVEKGLALSTLKGQISALAVFFQRPLALHSLVRTFLQGVAHIAPPVRSPLAPWDLNLVLSVLQGPPYEKIREIPLPLLTRKVAFLVAITSVRRVSELAALSCESPLLVLHRDKAVLRPRLSFLPKVVSAFHINEDLVLPSLCPKPKHPKEWALHCLDVVRALRVYLEATASVRKSDSLFVLPEGKRKGMAAAPATISKWIRDTVLQAYEVRGVDPPFRVTAHSTRAVGASWAFHHGASVAQVCKAATWSSVHTFTKHYKVDVLASADASLGRRVLQAAV